MIGSRDTRHGQPGKSGAESTRLGWSRRWSQQPARVMISAAGRDELQDGHGPSTSRWIPSTASSSTRLLPVSGSSGTPSRRCWTAATRHLTPPTWKFITTEQRRRRAHSTRKPATTTSAATSAQPRSRNPSSCGTRCSPYASSGAARSTTPRPAAIDCRTAHHGLRDEPRRRQCRPPRGHHHGRCVAGGISPYSPN